MLWNASYLLNSTVQIMVQMLWHRHPKVMQRWSADSGVLQLSGDHTPSALASTHDDHSTTTTCITCKNHEGREGGRLSAMTQGTCLPNRPQALSSPQSLGSLSAIPFPCGISQSRHPSLSMGSSGSKVPLYTPGGPPHFPG